MRRRGGNGHRDQDLALAQSRIEAAFGPVQVLEVRPNSRPAEERPTQGSQAPQEAAQAVLDLDRPQDDHREEGGEAVA